MRLRLVSVVGEFLLSCDGMSTTRCAESGGGGPSGRDHVHSLKFVVTLLKVRLSTRVFARRSIHDVHLTFPHSYTDVEKGESSRLSYTMQDLYWRETFTDVYDTLCIPFD